MNKDIKKVLIVSKMTELEFNEQKYGSAVDHYYKINKVDVKSLEKNHKYHYESLENIIKCFENHDIKAGIIKKQSLNQRDFKEKWDLVLPVGGDGTFMDVGRYILDDTLVMGIKSSPNSIGGHYNTNFSNAEEHIEKVLNGEFRVEKRTRVEGIIPNASNIRDLALNEIFVGDIYNPGNPLLEIYFKGKKYTSRSSGIIVSTYRGKTGWYDHIHILERDPEIIKKAQTALSKVGLGDRKINVPDAEFKTGEENYVRYKVREAKDIPENYGYEYGILKPGQELKIVSRAIADGSVSFDGSKRSRPRHRVYDLHYGSVVKIGVSDKPLHVVEI